MPLTASRVLLLWISSSNFYGFVFSSWRSFWWRDFLFFWMESSEISTGVYSEIVWFATENLEMAEIELLKVWFLYTRAEKELRAIDLVVGRTSSNDLLYSTVAFWTVSYFLLAIILIRDYFVTLYPWSWDKISLTVILWIEAMSESAPSF